MILISGRGLDSGLGSGIGSGIEVSRGGSKMSSSSTASALQMEARSAAPSEDSEDKRSMVKEGQSIGGFVA